MCLLNLSNRVRVSGNESLVMLMDIITPAPEYLSLNMLAQIFEGIAYNHNLETGFVRLNKFVRMS
jgi:hypothetical protein